MSRFYILLFAFLIYSGMHLAAQDRFGLMNSPVGGEYTDLVVGNDGTIYVAVNGSGVFRSVNKGANWQNASSGLENLFVRDIDLDGNGQLWAATLGGGIFKSNNGGGSWSAANGNLDYFLFTSVKAHPDGTIIAGTFGKGVYISTDEGATWQRRFEGLDYQDINTLNITENGRVLAGTFGGGIYGSRDTGRTWIIQNSGLNNLYINSFAASNATHTFAATNGGHIYKSPNEGISWAREDTFYYDNYEQNYFPIYDYNATSLFFNNMDEIYFGTRNSGIFWFDSDTYDAYRPATLLMGGIYGLGISPGDDMYATRSFSTILHTNTETMNEWDVVTPIKDNPQAVIFSPTVDTIFSADRTGKLFVSLDRGITWHKGMDANARVLDVEIDSTGKFWAGTTSGLFRSDDGGDNWQRVKWQDTIVNDISVASGNVILAARQYIVVSESGDITANDKALEFSVDGGNTWVKSQLDLGGLQESHLSELIARGNKIYIVRDDKISVSENFGQNWNVVYDAKSNIDDFDITPEGYFVCKIQRDIMASKDEGVKWLKIELTFPQIADPSPAISNPEATRDGRLMISYAFNEVGFGRQAIIFYTDELDEFLNEQIFDVEWEDLRGEFTLEEVHEISSNPDGDFYITFNNGKAMEMVNELSMNTPQLISPENNSFDFPVDGRLTWESAVKAETYQMQLAASDDFEFRWEFILTSDTLRDVLRQMDYNHDYWWRVRSKNDGAYSEWSDTYKFTTRLAPPELISPEDGSEGVPVFAELKWQTVVGADNYEIQVSLFEDFSDNVFTTETSTLSTITTQLSGVTKYYWRARAKNENSTGYWSDIWEFTTVPGPPELEYPANGDIGLPLAINFRWKPAEEATGYRVQVALDEEFTSIIIDDDFQSTETGQQISGLSYNSRYHYRIASFNEGGQSVWSESWSFLTAYAPVTKISPEDEAVNVQPGAEFSWTAHQIADDYAIRYATDMDFEDIVIIDTVEAAEAYVPSGLEYWSGYYWQVRPISSENFGLWENPWMFRTTLEQVGLRIPLDESIGQPTTLYMLWFAAEGAIRYHLQVANDENFTDLVFSQDTLTKVDHTIEGLQPGITYFWRVRGISEDGPGPWSEVWRFTTGSNIPVLLEPLNEAENVEFNTILKWRSENEDDTYNLQVDTDSEFGNPFVNESGLTETEYQLTNLDELTSYFWRVKAISGENESPWAPAWSFTTKLGGSVENDITLDGIKIYPNPFSEEVRISGELISPALFTAEIIDMSGATVYISERKFGDKIEITWKPGDISSGIYYLRIITESGTIIKEMSFIR